MSYCVVHITKKDSYHQSYCNHLVYYNGSTYLKFILFRHYIEFGTYLWEKSYEVCKNCTKRRQFKLDLLASVKL